MNARWWTEQEIQKALQLYEAGYPCDEIGQMLGRTESSVRLKLLSLGLSSRRVEVEPEPEIAAGISVPHVPQPMKTLPLNKPAQELIVESNPYELRARREMELGEQRRAEREKVEDAKRGILEDRILEEFRKTLCNLPPSFAPPLPPPPPPKTATPLIAALVVSDAHIGQTVDPREVAGFGEYNPALSMGRLRHLENEVLRILSGRPVEKLLLLFGGDIHHGQLGHTLEDDLTLPLALQVDLTLNLFFPFIRSLSQAVHKIEAYGVAGNHGRWPGMRKMPTDRRWSNLDTVLYGALADICRHSGLANVSFDDRISSRRTIEAGKFTIELLHGDEIRGGNFCIGGMNREVHNSTLRHLQTGRKPADYYVIGDKHFSASIPFGTGAFVVNGSWVGTDSFGLNFLPAPPSQTLFFLHPTLGKIETHEIRLDHARIEKPLPYQLKPNLEEIICRYL